MLFCCRNSIDFFQNEWKDTSRSPEAIFVPLQSSNQSLSALIEKTDPRKAFSPSDIRSKASSAYMSKTEIMSSSTFIWFELIERSENILSGKSTSYRNQAASTLLLWELNWAFLLGSSDQAILVSRTRSLSLIQIDNLLETIFLLQCQKQRLVSSDSKDWSGLPENLTCFELIESTAKNQSGSDPGYALGLASRLWR